MPSSLKDSLEANNKFYFLKERSSVNRKTLKIISVRTYRYPTESSEEAMLSPKTLSTDFSKY
jgi:hypothetical protein